MWIFVFRIFIRNNRRERKYCGLWVENFCQIKRIIDLHKLPYYIVLDVHSSIVSNMEFIVGKDICRYRMIRLQYIHVFYQYVTSILCLTQPLTARAASWSPQASSRPRMSSVTRRQLSARVHRFRHRTDTSRYSPGLTTYLSYQISV